MTNFNSLLAGFDILEARCKHLEQQQDKLLSGLERIARDCENDPAAILAKELIADVEK